MSGYKGFLKEYEGKYTEIKGENAAELKLLSENNNKDEWNVSELKELTDKQNEIFNGKDQEFIKLEIVIDTQVRIPIINNTPKNGFKGAIGNIVTGWCKRHNIHKDNIVSIRPSLDNK